MWGFWPRTLARLILGLAGAFLLAGAVAALPAAAGGGTGAAHYLAGWASHLGALAHFRLGLSQTSDAPAAAELARRLPATLQLVGGGAVIALLLGLPLGLVLGTGRRLRAAAPLVQIVAAAPVFCAGLLLLWLADHVLGWSGGRHVAVHLWSARGAADVEAWLRAVALPALTVGAAGAAAVQLALRRAMAQAVEAPWRRGLRAMGLGGLETDLAYLAPVVFSGLLASLGEITLALFSAAAVAEWVFDWPGAAVLFVKSVALRDWDVAALVLLVFAAIKLIADCAGAIGAHLLAPGEAAR